MVERNRVLITSALPYANGPLHFGHIAGAYLPADCHARFCRLKGDDVLFLCGSDEYGIAITLSAEKAGRTPKEHVDIFHQVNQNFFRQLNISFDHYSRTTWPGHVEPVHQFFNDLVQNGYIEERECEQLYSEKDQRFLADRYVVGTCPKCGYENARGDECQKCGASYEAPDLKNPRSAQTKAPLTLKKTRHWFLLLEKFRDQLLEWLDKKDWKPNVVNFIKSYIKDLRARAITRDMSWGVPLPLENSAGKVLYVWFDAPIGYISAAQEWAQKIGKPDHWRDYWCNPKTRLVNFIGKDNIPFHAAIFPAMLMGQNQPYKIVDDLPANEFYNLEGRQFSKSDGWYIDLEEFFKHYQADQIRYAIASNAPETSDSEFTWNDFQRRCNTELLGKYGNLANRTFVFAKNHCDGRVPQAESDDLATEFLNKVYRLAVQIAEDYSNYNLRRACQTMMQIAQEGNAYFDQMKPWIAAKDPERYPEMRRAIYSCLECLKVLALVSWPIIPATAEKLWRLLGYHEKLDKVGNWDSILKKAIPAGQKLEMPEILFRKIEDTEIKVELEKMKQMSEAAQAQQGSDFEPLKGEIDIESFRQLDLRVGLIKQAERVAKSKKLLKLEVDIGFEARTIVSGISEHYAPDEVLGKKVIVVANLKPAKLMGIESHGMILAGHFSKELEVVNLQELPPGSVVS